MWTFLLIVGLLDQNQAAPIAADYGDAFRLIPQQEPVLITPSTTTVINQQTGSSSSSSSSASSESSQSSEDPQQMREQQNQENAALEQMDLSQEFTSYKSTDLWLNQPALVRDGTDERQEQTEDNSVESQHKALLLNLHHLLDQPQTKETIPTMEVGGDTMHVGEAVLEGAGAEGNIVHTKFLTLDSVERENGLTFDTPDHDHYHGHHGDDVVLELGL